MSNEKQSLPLSYLPSAEHVWAPGQDSIVQVRVMDEVVAEINWTKIWKKVLTHFGVKLLDGTEPAAAVGSPPAPTSGPAKLTVVPNP